MRITSKLLVLIALLSGSMLVGVAELRAQTCAQANWVLNTQSQVEFLGGLDCSQIAGDLTITGSSITSLSALSNLVTVEGRLDITSNNSLQTLEGLAGVSAIGGDLNISHNSALYSICDLEGVTSIGLDLTVAFNGALKNGYGDQAYCAWSLVSVGGDVLFEENPALEELGYLSSLTAHAGSLAVRNSVGSLANFQHAFNLTSVDGDLILENNLMETLAELRDLTSVGGSLVLRNNDLLQSADHLGSLVSIGGSLVISDNAALKHVDALMGLQTVGGNLSVLSNSSLDNCVGLVPVLGYGDNPGGVAGSITLSANSYGCNSTSEIFSAVQAPGQPFITDIRAGDGAITITAAVPEEGTFPVNALRGKCTDALGNASSKEGGASTVTVSGLTNGRAYTCTVVALSDGGESIASGESIAVTPSERPQIDPAVLWFIIRPPIVEDEPVLPGTPGTPSVLSAGAGAVTLSWTAPASDGGATITGYRIQANIDGTSSWPTVKDNTGSASTSYTVTGLTEGETYRFRVAAINSVGPGANSGSSSLITIESTGAGGLTLAEACINPPPIVVCDKTRIPADFYTTWGSGEITQPASKILSMPFIVEESTTADGDFAYKSFMSSVTAASDYTFNLWISETPNGPLLDNNRFCLIASKTNSTMPWTQGTPGYLECGLGSANRILYVNSKLFKTAANGTETETLYPYSAAPRDVRYTLSSWVSTDPNFEPGLPSAPSRPAVRSAGAGAVTLSWSSPENDGGAAITGYRIERRTGAGSWVIEVSNTGSPSASRTVSGLINNASYTFRVAAINSRGVGAFSSASDSFTVSGGCDSPYNTNIDCSDEWGPTLYDPTPAPNGKETVTIARGKIRSIPIRMTVANNLAEGMQYFTTYQNSFYDEYSEAPCTQTDVANNVQTCKSTSDAKMVLGSDGVPDFVWETWVSNEPGDNYFDGTPYQDTGACYQEGYPSDFTIRWTQVSPSNPYKCYLGSEVRTVYFNYRLRDPLGNSAYYIPSAVRPYEFEIRKVVTKDETGQRPAD